MKAAIYNPYLDTLGGGERYTMTVAQTLKKNRWDVDVEWKDKEILQKMEEQFGLDLKGVNIVSSVKNGKGYDLLFWVSDGSVARMHAKKNILHFQVPFHKNQKTLFNRLKLLSVHKVVCNSKFTKHFIDNAYDVSSTVVYPPVDVNRFKSTKKEKLILGVGRFSQLLQSKRQDILVSAFKAFAEYDVKKWKMVLAGGSSVGGQEYARVLKNHAKGYTIDIIENPTNDQLTHLYEKARIFWSASGFGIDEEKEPEKVEHFGITTVEAMAAGVVPFVYNAGGAKEIINHFGKNGFLWETEEELVGETLKLIKNERRISEIGQETKQRAQAFSQERFERQIMEII